MIRSATAITSAAATVALFGIGFAVAQPPAESVPDAPPLSFAFEARVQVGEPLDVGDVTHGRRRIVEILGGTFEGPDIKGRVLPGGADWQMVQADGFSELDTRYTLETDDGDVIYVQNAGVRHAPPDVMRQLNAGQAVDPSLVYFRTIPKFETSAPELQWLVCSVFLCVGERYPEDVVIRFWRVE
jgi:hypothetical protein